MKIRYYVIIGFVIIALIITGIFLFKIGPAIWGSSEDGPTAFFIAGKLPEGSDTVEYTSITMKEAEEIFKMEGDYIILDVRRADEFAEGHLPGAVNVANEDILDVEPAELPDKNQTIYVYCRSGNRSRQAAAKLAKMGYTNIIEFGGIIDWNGEVEK